MSPTTILWPIRCKPLLIVGWTVFLLASGRGTGPAQIVLDGKFGTSGALSGPNYTVTAAMGSVRGNNLFQSFSQFNLTSGEVATFTGPANIQNVLSRVTGGSPSSIDGTIRSDIAGANFFFLNPSGVIFGPNASVDVSGSFAVTTASYLKLADGARFVAALGADDSGLSTAPVSAFGFLGNNAGSIAVQRSTLQVQDGKTLSLVGGDITVDGGSVRSAGGQINIVSVNSPGELPVDPAGLSLAELNSTFPQPGQILLQNGAQLDASGEGGGRIVIRGGSLMVDNSKIQANTTGATDGQGIDVAVANDLNLANGGQIVSLSTLGLGSSGDINVTAKSIKLDGGGIIDDETHYPTTQISTSTGDPAAGGGPGGGSARGGDIRIQTGSLELVNSAQISSASFGAGNAGRIDLTASSIVIDALLTTVAQISANTLQNNGGGNAGDIVISAGTLDIRNGASLVATTFGSGNAGRIDLTANSVNMAGFGLVTTATYGTGDGGSINVTANSVLIDSSFIQAATTFTDADPNLCQGGSVSITAGSLDIRNGGLVSATTYGSGAGGVINLTANSITLSGDNGVSGLPTGISAASGQDYGGGFIFVGTGNGGDVVIKPLDSGALDLAISDGAKISTTTLGSGNGGRIDIAVSSLSVNSGGNISSASSSLDPGAGTAGNVNVKASGSITLTDHSFISTAAPNSNGGNISVIAGNDIRLKNSQITAQAGLDGGNIEVSAPKLVYLLNSTITAEADATGSGFGNGGNITIDPSFLILNHSGLISKSSFGNGGNINILTDYFLQSASLIDASAPFGLPGTVSVSAPQIDLSGSLIGLPGNLLNAEDLLRPDCAVRLAGNLSSFTVLGRGGLPIQPGGFVPSGTVPPRDDSN